MNVNEDGKRFSLLALALMLIGALVIVAVNLLIDPYDVHGVWSRAGVNANKPQQRFHDRLHKAHAIYRQKPDGVLLGTSRTQVGLNPLLPALRRKAEHVLNVGLSNGHPYEARRYLQHAHAVRPQKLVIMGLDLRGFDATSESKNVEFSEERLAVDAEFRPARLSWAFDWPATLLSVDALRASASTVLKQKEPSYFDASGQRRSVFLERRLIKSGGMRANMLRLERRHIEIFACHQLVDAKGESPVTEVARLVAFSREQKIPVQMFFSPTHARDLLVIRAIGLWPTFERWKRAIVDAVGNDAVVWDFSGANRYTSELVPPFADAEARMRYYWESSHYRSTLGDLVLERIVGAPEREETRGFGVVLTKKTIDGELARIAAEIEVYAKANPDAVTEIERARDEILPKARIEKRCPAAGTGHEVAAQP